MADTDPDKRSPMQKHIESLPPIPGMQCVNRWGCTQSDLNSRLDDWDCREPLPKDGQVLTVDLPSGLLMRITLPCRPPVFSVTSVRLRLYLLEQFVKEEKPLKLGPAPQDWWVWQACQPDVFLKEVYEKHRLAGASRETIVEELLRWLLNKRREQQEQFMQVCQEHPSVPSIPPLS